MNLGEYALWGTYREVSEGKCTIWSAKATINCAGNQDLRQYKDKYVAFFVLFEMILAIMETNTPEGEEKIRALLTNRHTTESSESHTLPSIQRGQQLPTKSPAHISSLPRTTPRRPNKPYTTDPSSTSNVEGDFPTREGTSQPSTTPNLQRSRHHPFRTGLNTEQRWN